MADKEIRIYAIIQLHNATLKTAVYVWVCLISRSWEIHFDNS